MTKNAPKKLEIVDVIEDALEERKQPVDRRQRQAPPPTGSERRSGIDRRQLQQEAGQS